MHRSMGDSRAATLRIALFAVFALSGFAGLVYESLWSHYLKLMLGHAAYAQTLVLAIYMGGLSLGAWLASRSERWRAPLAAYALIELAIGVSALAFHALFVAADGWLHDALLPALASPAAGALARWTVGALLMLPQAVLLGMTFPLMSAGALRLDPARAGATVGTLYFTNCIGAAVGVLAGAFLLLPRLGLPGTLLVAGALNVLVGVAVLLLARGRETAPPLAAAAVPVAGAAPRLILAAAALTGFASFCYELAWIRQLSLVLGSTVQAFELMLSAFITGLALGGWWIRKRADASPAPLRLAGWVQVAMGALAALTLPVYAQSFDWMGALLRALARSDEGYAAFTLASHGIALVVMLPATVMAGMTLPLFTAAALRSGAGERAVGRVYALNTLGCIAGALVAVHLLFPTAGTHGTIYLGAAVDVALGLGLLALGVGARRELAAAALAGVGTLVAVMAAYTPDTRRLASGVYRNARAALHDDTEVLYHRDGRTATVDLFRERADHMVIATNGKPDAAINPGADGPLAFDESTMTLIAVYGIALRPAAREAVAIGFGSGMSTHTLLAWPGFEAVHTVEIEPAMVEAARGFGPKVARAYDDPRSRVHIDDAKAWLAVQRRRFPLVLSEPSNPWVSGVAGLFSVEFYARLKRHLTPDGVLLQWLHAYETDAASVASVYAALAPHFRAIQIYAMNDADLLFAASDGPLGPLDEAPFTAPALRAVTAPLGVRGALELAERRIGDRSTLGPWFDRIGAPANSDYFPFLSFHAPRARYLNSDVYALGRLLSLPVPATRWLNRLPRPAAGGINATRMLRAAVNAGQARELAALLRGAAPGAAAAPNETQRLAVALFRAAAAACTRGREAPPAGLDVAADTLGAALNPYLGHQPLRDVWETPFPAACRAGWPASLRARFAFHAAVARDDLAAVAHAARVLLAGEPERHAAARETFLIAGVAADLARGRAREAWALWARYAPAALAEAGDPLPLQWLGALARKQAADE